VQNKATEEIIEDKKLNIESIIAGL